MKFTAHRSSKSNHEVRGFALGCIATLLIAAGLASPASAQDDEKKLGWFNTAEVSIVATDGNSQATTIGLGASIRRVWADRAVKFDAAGLRSDATTFSRRAVGTSTDDFELIERSSTERTAENITLRGRYDRDLSEQLFWYAGLGWERDQFAGIDSRSTAAGGFGYIFYDTDLRRFRIDGGVTYTREDNTDGGTDEFPGLRLSWDLFRQLTDSTKFGSALVIDQNLDDTDDLRATALQFIAVSMSEQLALKVSLELKYDNQPALRSIPLELADGTLTGTSVRVPLDELDSLLTVALVLNF